MNIILGYCTMPALVTEGTIMLESIENSSHQMVTVGLFEFQYEACNPRQELGGLKKKSS